MRVLRERTVAAALLCMVLAVAARPSHDGLYEIDDTRKPVYRGTVRTRERKSDAEVIVKSDISVIGPEDARQVKPTHATPLSESLKMVTHQLLEGTMATDMVAADVRTPPKIKNQHRKEESNQNKGEAIPIIIGNKTSQVEVSPPTSTQSSIQTSQGFSTWVLVNNEQSTSPTKKKPVSLPLASSKKPSVSNNMENRKSNETTKVERKPVSTKPLPSNSKKTNTTKEDLPKPIVTLHDSKFKNRTPVIVGRIPVPSKNNKTENKKPAASSTLKTEESSEKQKVTTLVPGLTTPRTTAHHYVQDIVPTVSLVTEINTIDSSDSSTAETTSTTKTTRRPTTKKKKNKNRRRRPTKTDVSKLESKITPDTNSSKVETFPNRPLSTRIYNYLAREVMPSVGVGIVGLVLTAGLAGLLLYPFGGGIARRNYEKISGPSPDGHMYYYNDYTPGVDLDQGNVQAEETVFGQVLSGMNHNGYSNRYDPQKYNTNKYRYDAVDYNNGNVNGYAGSSEYSTLPDSIKNSDYSTLPESNKYYMEPMSPQYKVSDNLPEIDKYNAEENKYPSLTEYTAYTNAASVGTSGTYENDRHYNKSNMTEEDKSDKSQPQFAALVGSPQFSDFVGSVAVSGSYGTEVRHRSGALAIDHGPRSLEIKSRKAREVSDDSMNEIDDTEDNYVKSSTSGNSGETEKNSISDTTTSLPEVITTLKTETTTVKEQEEFNFFELIRRIAQAKLKLGITFLRSTSEAFQHYFDHIATKMEKAVHNLEKNSTQMNITDSNTPLRRGKRAIKKTLKKKYYLKKHKQH